MSWSASFLPRSARVNRPVPGGRSGAAVGKNAVHAPLMHACFDEHAGAQGAASGLVHVEIDGSPFGIMLTIAAWMQNCPMAQRPAQEMRVMSTLLIVQSAAADGFAFFATARRSSEKKPPRLSLRPVAMYAIEGTSLASSVS